MDIKDIQQFFEQRPALSKRALAKEIGISRQYLDYILNEDRPLTEATRAKMKPVLEKYGYEAG